MQYILKTENNKMVELNKDKKSYGNEKDIQL